MAGSTISVLLGQLRVTARNFANLARKLARQPRDGDCLLDTLDNPPQFKTFAGTIGHVITHRMHHRAQVMGK